MTWTANGAAAPAQLRFPPALRIDHTRADLRALWLAPGAA
jgi:hypothetical protein